ncbi:MAG: PocR ligand-binding domain-containing protein [Clostridia bacterium]|nr:PocR ligand-binding domain-containing protein [Clostridia bacterium]
MLVHANKDELQLLAKSFYDVSRTLLTVYDANKKIICSYPNKMCTFCAEVRKSPELTKECLKCDGSALEMCSRTHSVYAYKCHMGLLEVAAPIMQNDIAIGYMLFGQITDHKDKTALLAGLKETANKYGLDYAVLKDGIQKIKYRSSDYIASISKMMEMCASYIWQNSFLRIKSNTTAHCIDLYISENLNRKLTVELLCSEFHISRSTLYSISKTHFGCGITDYIALRRINKAKELLCADEKPIAEIASLLGMDNTGYFIRFFKKHTGITPKKYRMSS